MNFAWLTCFENLEVFCFTGNSVSAATGFPNTLTRLINVHVTDCAFPLKLLRPYHNRLTHLTLTLILKQVEEDLAFSRLEELGLTSSELKQTLLKKLLKSSRLVKKVSLNFGQSQHDSVGFKTIHAMLFQRHIETIIFASSVSPEAVELLVKRCPLLRTLKCTYPFLDQAADILEIVNYSRSLKLFVVSPRVHITNSEFDFFLRRREELVVAGIAIPILEIVPTYDFGYPVWSQKARVVFCYKTHCIYSHCGCPKSTAY